MHNLNRRVLLAALAVSPAVLAVGPKLKSPQKPARIGGYNLRTVPDAAGRTVLARQLSRLDQGRLPGQTPHDAIKANLQQIIEQNVARLDPKRITRLVALPEDHKRALAQLYVNCSGNSPHPPLLHDLLAQRLTAPELAEQAQYFGFVPLYVAIARSAPEKLRTFESMTSTALVGPTYGGRTHSSNLGVRELLDLPFGDIWIAVRLAPIGLYSLSASAFMFASLVGGAISSGWYGGYNVAGPLIVSGLQTFVPSIWDSIVDGVGWFLNELQTKPPEEQGPVQELGASAMHVPEMMQGAIVETGGDYLINELWSDSRDWTWSWGDGGGGGCGRSGRELCEFV